MTCRSNRIDVRNPALALPSVRVLRAMPNDYRRLHALLLLDLQRDARARARKGWDSHKAFIAACWCTVAVYAGHFARALLDKNDRHFARQPFRVRQPGYPDIPAADWAEASRLYSDRRDAEGVGASEFADAIIVVADTAIARISYNGRIWPLDHWDAETVPLYDNRVEGAH